MLDPRWDVTKQWDGTPAFGQGARFTTRSPSSPPRADVQHPGDDRGVGVS